MYVPRPHHERSSTVPQAYLNHTTSVPGPHLEHLKYVCGREDNVVCGAALAPAQIYSIVVYQDNNNLLSRSELAEPNPAKPRLRDGNNRTYSTCTRFEACREYKAGTKLECTVPRANWERTQRVPDRTTTVLRTIYHLVHVPGSRRV